MPTKRRGARTGVAASRKHGRKGGKRAATDSSRRKPTPPRRGGTSHTQVTQHLADGEGRPAHLYLLTGYVYQRSRFTRQFGEFEVRPFLQAACAARGVRLHFVRISVGASQYLRLAFSFPDWARRDDDALRLRDHLRFVECVHGWMWETIDVVPIRREHVGLTGRVNTEALLADLTNEGGPLEASETVGKLGNYAFGSVQDLLWRWSCLPAVAAPLNERAASYLYESHARAWFANRERINMARSARVSQQMSKQRPSLPSEVARLEAATTMAFKVVEALLGNVRPEREEIRRRLFLSGFPATEPVPHWPHRPLFEEVFDLACARDQRAAHGSGSRHSVVTYYEVMGWQVCAQIMMSEALRRGNLMNRLIVSLLKGRIATGATE